MICIYLATRFVKIITIIKQLFILPKYDKLPNKIIQGLYKYLQILLYGKCFPQIGLLIVTMHYFEQLNNFTKLLNISIFHELRCLGPRVQLN